MKDYPLCWSVAKKINPVSFYLNINISDAHRKYKHIKHYFNKQINNTIFSLYFYFKHSILT